MKQYPNRTKQNKTKITKNFARQRIGVVVGKLNRDENGN